jgi:hypothetical protein
MKVTIEEKIAEIKKAECKEDQIEYPCRWMRSKYKSCEQCIDSRIKEALREE